MEKLLTSLSDVEQEAKELAARLSPRAEGATLVTLSGELGAGKTAFTKALASALGVSEHVTSPTYVLEKIYALANSSFARLVHIDAYRLKEGSELSALGFDELARNSENLIVLEWPEMVADALPKADVAISLEALEDGSRKITYA